MASIYNLEAQASGIGSPCFEPTIATKFRTVEMIVGEKTNPGSKKIEAAFFGRKPFQTCSQN